MILENYTSIYLNQINVTITEYEESPFKHLASFNGTNIPWLPLVYRWFQGIVTFAR